MEKTIASLFIAMIASVMAIPFAYFAGRTGAEHSLRASIENRLEQAQAEQDAALAALRREVAKAALGVIPGQRGSTRSPNQKRPAPTWSLGPAEGAETQVDGSAPLVAVDSFENLDVGITYEQTVNRLGREGTRTMSMVDTSGEKTEQYHWAWLNDDGTIGKVDISFVDGRLQDKAYRG